MHTKTVRMLGKLPKTFTYVDVEKDLNIDNAYARVLCSRWIKDGPINGNEYSVRPQRVVTSDLENFCKPSDVSHAAFLRFYATI